MLRCFGHLGRIACGRRARDYFQGSDDCAIARGDSVFSSERKGTAPGTGFASFEGDSAWRKKKEKKINVQVNQPAWSCFQIVCVASLGSDSDRRTLGFPGWRNSSSTNKPRESLDDAKAWPSGTLDRKSFCLWTYVRLVLTLVRCVRRVRVAV